jgi:hypothetical protein
VGIGVQPCCCVKGGLLGMYRDPVNSTLGRIYRFPELANVPVGTVMDADDFSDTLAYTDTIHRPWCIEEVPGEEKILHAIYAISSPQYSVRWDRYRWPSGEFIDSDDVGIPPIGYGYGGTYPPYVQVTWVPYRNRIALLVSSGASGVIDGSMIYMLRPDNKSLETWGDSFHKSLGYVHSFQFTGYASGLTFPRACDLGFEIPGVSDGAARFTGNLQFGGEHKIILLGAAPVTTRPVITKVKIGSGSTLGTTEWYVKPEYALRRSWPKDWVLKVTDYRGDIGSTSYFMPPYTVSPKSGGVFTVTPNAAAYDERELTSGVRVDGITADIDGNIFVLTRFEQAGVSSFTVDSGGPVTAPYFLRKLTDLSGISDQDSWEIRIRGKSYPLFDASSPGSYETFIYQMELVGDTFYFLGIKPGEIDPSRLYAWKADFEKASADGYIDLQDWWDIPTSRHVVTKMGREFEPLL